MTDGLAGAEPQAGPPQGLQESYVGRTPMKAFVAARPHGWHSAYVTKMIEIALPVSHFPLERHVQK